MAADRGGLRNNSRIRESPRGRGKEHRAARAAVAISSSWENGGASLCASGKPSAPSSPVAQELI